MVKTTPAVTRGDVKPFRHRSKRTIDSLPKSGGTVGPVQFYVVSGREVEVDISGMDTISAVTMYISVVLGVPHSAIRLTNIDGFGPALTDPVAVLVAEKVDRVVLLDVELERHFLRCAGLYDKSRFDDEVRDKKTLSIYSTQVYRLPESIGRLESITQLDLVDAGLEALPNGFGRLAALNGLTLDQNVLRSLPDSFGELSSLETLNLGSNCLTELPQSFGRLGRLQRFQACGNKLASFPRNFGKLVALRECNLKGNCLQYVPADVKNLTSLEILDVSFNVLTCLPAHLPESMTRLNVDHNNLVKLPDSIGELVRLQFLNAATNALGELPSSLRLCQELTWLDVAGNRLSSLPEYFSSLRLTWLNISYNTLCSLPATFKCLPLTISTLRAHPTESLV